MAAGWGAFLEKKGLDMHVGHWREGRRGGVFWQPRVVWPAAMTKSLLFGRGHFCGRERRAQGGPDRLRRAAARGRPVNATGGGPEQQAGGHGRRFRGQGPQASRRNLVNLKGAGAGGRGRRSLLHRLRRLPAGDRQRGRRGADRLPSRFHPAYLKAAVDAGKHVFLEKLHAIDPPGIRTVMAACEEGPEEELSVVSGLAWRYTRACARP